ncbi:hypothetical protein [Alkanindiges illinoisensis]|uniref:Restriction endonuclease n=1 Tax=Alkanindiges illinoisensis TaxID=197183 RepID=A0A4Y7XA72_9GAMM|nr:hypothetical protein [Alkanindiges illinoisensis]TEU23329.1 hypothetical protein E2B99_13490 [Alkanindiges illinoisensis]
MLSNPNYNNPKLLRLMSRLHPTSYDMFIETLYEDIEDILKRLAKDRAAHLRKYQATFDASKSVDKNKNDLFKIFEDDINMQIVRSLESKEYEASHDKFSNGHVDIYVELEGYPYIWFGESKIWGGASDIDGGFKQLNNAYSTGDDDECCGGIIIYVVDTQLATNDILSSWAEMLLEIKTPKVSNSIDDLSVSCAICDVTDWARKKYSDQKSLRRNRFNSSHKHPSSGLPYHMRHFTLDLRHERRD